MRTTSHAINQEVREILTGGQAPAGQPSPSSARTVVLTIGLIAIVVLTVIVGH